MHSIAPTEIQQHLLFADITDLWIDVPLNLGTFIERPPFPLYQNVDQLLIECESQTQRTTFWESVINKLCKQKLYIITLFFACLGHIIRIDNKIYQKERFNRIACLVDLNKITKLEFYRTNDLSLVDFIEPFLL
jgi:hypothetical protein